MKSEDTSSIFADDVGKTRTVLRLPLYHDAFLRENKVTTETF